MTYLGELISIGVAFSWTATALLSEFGSKRLGNLTLNVLRMALALVFSLVLFLVVTGNPLPTGKKGKVKVLKDKKIIREIEEGSCFGKLSLLINEPRSATVETITSRNAAEKQKILIKYILKEKRVLLKLAHHL